MVDASLPDIAYVDTIDACHLKCPSCPKGVRTIANTGRKMPLDTFSRIIAKLKTAGYQRIGLYNWTEPFLNRTLEEYIERVKDSGLYCELSSTLSLRHIDNLEAALLAGFDRMIVSMSGLDQAVYEINHVGGTVEYAVANLHRIRAIIDRHALPTRITMRLLRFGYNADQEPEVRALADALRFELEVAEAACDPTSEGRQQKRGNDHFERMLTQAGPSDTPEASGKICGLMFDQITIDAVGDVHLCCAFPTLPSLRIGAYLDLPDSEILLRRYTHPMCRTCNFPRRQAAPGDGERILRAVRERMMPALAEVA